MIIESYKKFLPLKHNQTLSHMQTMGKTTKIKESQNNSQQFYLATNMQLLLQTNMKLWNMSQIQNGNLKGSIGNKTRKEMIARKEKLEKKKCLTDKIIHLKKERQQIIPRNYVEYRSLKQKHQK